MSGNFFLYFEEIEWASRLKNRLKIGWEPKSIMYQKEGASIGTSNRPRGSGLVLYYLNINFLYYDFSFIIVNLSQNTSVILFGTIRFYICRDWKRAGILGSVLFDLVRSEWRWIVAKQERQ